MAEVAVASLKQATRRLPFIDNIRWTMIVLVLSMHASDTYSPFGNWYYTEHPPIDFAETLTFAFYQSFLQAFFMALLFLVSGYFAAGSYERKGAAAFARERAFRLGIPTLLYMFAIGPLTQYFLSHTWGQGGFVHQWLLHITDGQILSETGPMWFAAVLLLLSLLFAGLRAIGVSADRFSPKPPPAGAVLTFILVMACMTFLIRIPLPENISVLNIHPGDFPQYILMFSVGILAGYRGWLIGIPRVTGLRWAAILVATSLALFAALVIWGGAVEGRTADYSGGANAVSFFKCLWESMVCVGMTLAIVILFREAFNRQGKLAKVLSDNAFAVYVIHPPVIIALAIMIHGFSAPALVKAALLTLLAAVATFLLSWLVVRQLPLLKRVL
jgi:surface polysaccharide O-acyltransferase-like enzyme